MKLAKVYSAKMASNASDTPCRPKHARQSRCGQEEVPAVQTKGPGQKRRREQRAHRRGQDANVANDQGDLPEEPSVEPKRTGRQWGQCGRVGAARVSHDQASCNRESGFRESLRPTFRAHRASCCQSSGGPVSAGLARSGKLRASRRPGTRGVQPGATTGCRIAREG